MKVILNIVEPRKKKLLQYVLIVGLILSTIGISCNALGVIGEIPSIIIAAGWFPFLMGAIGIDYYMKPFRLNGNTVLLETNTVTIILGDTREKYKSAEVELHLNGYEDVGHPLVHTANYGGNNFIKTPNGTSYNFYLKRQSDLFRVKNFLVKSHSKINIV